MGRQAAEASDRAIPCGMDGAASLPAQRVPPVASPASEPKALLAFAEELGRLMARRPLTDTNRRKGYDLPEMLIGSAFDAVMLVLVYYLITWLRR